MSHPDEETLAAFALGDVRELGPEVPEHTQSCVTCSATVEALRRTVVHARAGAEVSPMAAVPRDLWSRIEAEVDALDAGAGALPRDRTDTSRPTAPDAVRPIEAAPSMARDGTETSRSTGSDAVRPIETAPSTTRGRAAGRRFSLSWAAGLAAAGVAIGLLTGRALWQDQAPEATTVATTRLDTLDTRQRLGDAALLRTDSGVDLQVATSPLDDGDGYLEVWLINSDGKRMVSVGVLRGDGPARFPISQSLIDQGYVIVDISREGFDDKPEHSGDSLARGTLPS